VTSCVAKKPSPVRMGVVAETASISDRLDRVERKADDLLRMIDTAIRQPGCEAGHRRRCYDAFA
jgi:hypothetical protein